MPYPLEEPTAELREAARIVRQTFVALVNAGFSEQQALIIVGQILTMHRPDEGGA
jgi:hypothetical protein